MYASFSSAPSTPQCAGLCVLIYKAFPKKGAWGPKLEPLDELYPRPAKGPSTQISGAKKPSKCLLAAKALNANLFIDFALRPVESPFLALRH